MKLHTGLGPNPRTVRMFLAEKGVTLPLVEVDLMGGENRRPPYTDKNPAGQLPCLELDDGTILAEVLPICEYIEETQPGPRLHPEDPLERARHRGWMEFGSAILGDIWGLETTARGETFAAKRAALAAKFARVDEALGQGPYFAGARFSLVDAVFGPVFRYFDVFDAIADTGLFARTPKVRAWRAALARRPSVVQAVGQDYPERLHAFLVRHDAHLLKLAA